MSEGQVGRRHVGKAVLIAGPTASGKSALALELAAARGGTIINADSQQIYRDLSILSARPDAAAVRRVPHRLYGFLDAAERGSVALWRERALAEIAIREAWDGGSLKLVVHADIPASHVIEYMHELGFELWIGDAAEIRTKRVRKQKTDRQDAQLLLRLLLEDRFPRIWVPDAANRNMRQLLWHRHRLVQMRTRVMNQLLVVALNEGLRRKKALWRPAGRAELESIVLAPILRQQPLV